MHIYIYSRFLPMVPPFLDCGRSHNLSPLRIQRRKERERERETTTEKERARKTTTNITCLLFTFGRDWRLPLIFSIEDWRLEISFQSHGWKSETEDLLWVSPLEIGD